MAKISEVTRLEFADAIKPYQSKITAILSKEKTVLNAIAGGGKEAPYKKLMLCEDMIYVSSLYMAQNSISLKILEVKNNDALNDARKILYKAIIYLEELVTNIIDIPYVDLAKNYEQIADYSVAKRFYLIRKLGLAITLLEDAFGDNSKWKWSFIELKGRFAVVAKNCLDMRKAAKAYFDPNNEDYETVVLYIRMLIKLLDASASGYRDKYELSTRRIDDMRNGIKFLLARHKLALALNDAKTAEEIKKKALVWKDKMDADQKSGSSR
ncbi:MAG: hypothetical protein SPF11_03595 [Treponema porcinum]|uniref:hypothetical protein n=1 Tax=Treponema porcinum TaxID=261392 RepID=UPI002356AFB4|nr:hypothetical protein [Treponema porcinum]MCI6322440.1 hypothetical protein [Treponema porcinum]MCI6480778.1 hypothetical protein [Treponema porcinum]MCI6816378.1 hypothetical protein [Treponema porcinum]MCI7079481.1 hypothetical protein [Treponema porcinum]MCI7114510.1 hypothetical protein [Treponema porcinum]